MKKLGIFLIFSFLIIFSLQQIVFAEADEKEKREKEVLKATENYKRKIIEKEIEEEEKIEEEPKIKKKSNKLIKLLPTENRLEEITLRTIWKYVDTQSTLDEEVDIETTTAVLRDITRVYDPINNKYKIPIIQIEIIKYDDMYELENYWDEITSSTIKEIFENAYLIGSPSKEVDCMFNYSTEGAVTLCITDEYVVQSVIYDKYQEHFSYNKLKTDSKKLQINQDEMTTRIVEEILKNIEKKKEIESDYQLFEILESNKEKEENKRKLEKDIKKEHIENRLPDIEKDKKYGIQNFACNKDEFGLITISGQFNNNQIKKDKIILEILFLDYERNIIFKNTVNLLEINEFETKRFLGNTKIDESFSTCTIKVKN